MNTEGFAINTNANAIQQHNHIMTKVQLRHMNSVIRIRSTEGYGNLLPNHDWFLRSKLGHTCGF